MNSFTRKSDFSQPAAETDIYLFWFDPIEAGERDRVREFIQAMARASWMRHSARPGRRDQDLRHGPRARAPAIRPAPSYEA
jgi:hypothetical protein